MIPLTRSVSGPKLKLTTAKYYTPSGRCIQKEEQLKDGALAEDDDTDGSKGALPDSLKAAKGRSPSTTPRWAAWSTAAAGSCPIWSWTT